jgi:hypothetical protein
VTLFFTTAASIELKCRLIGYDPEYDEAFKNDFGDLIIRSDYYCGLGFNDGKNLIVTHMYNRSHQNVIGVALQEISPSILTPNFYERFPNLKKVIIFNMSKKDINLDCFKSFQTLEELYLVHNIIPVLDNFTFVDLKNLTVLILHNNSIEEIHEAALAGLKKLQILNISDNKNLTYLHPKIFKDLVNLQNLFLESNSIKTLSPFLLRSLVNLQLFYFYGQILDSIPDGFFQNNAILTDILFNAKLSFIPNRAFRNLKKLKNLDLKENSCISYEFFDHFSSPIFTEDMLIPCSCKSIIELKNANNTRTISLMVYLGIVFVVVSILLIWNYKQHQKSENYSESTFMKIVKNLISEYTQNTSVHGLIHTANQKSYFITRIFWVAIVIVSTVFCLFFIVNNYYLWKKKPIILGFNEQLTDIFEVPFPAVTICANFKFDKNKIDIQKLLDEYQTGNASHKT